LNRWFEPLSTAWVGVLTHKLRSFLTMLGIVIGVAAVIALMSVGKGVEADIISRIESLGSDLLFITPGATEEWGGIKGAAGSAESLTLEDATAIAEQIPNITAVAPFYSSGLQVIVGSENTRSQVTGITPEYQQVYNLEMAKGTFISGYDYQRGTKVAVIGPNVEEALFNGIEPVGQLMRMGRNIVRVIGVLESKGAFMMSSDDTIFIPLTAMQQMVTQPRSSKGESVVSSIALTVSDGNQTDYVMERITNLLRDRHQLGPGIDDDFTLTSMEELISMLSEMVGTMTLLLGAIAAISLLVGGIGVMNIMLVSVLERTREIGIRKALGAKERDIWGQFLIEAVFLTFAGGIIGVILGWVASAVIGNMGPITTLITADIVILAVSVSVGIGLFFGFYPAWRASRLNPIEALRSE